MAIQLRTLFCSAAAALLLGVPLGLAAADGIRPASAPAAPLYPRSTIATDPVWSDTATDCAGCTRYDEGYRWASSRRLTTTDDCFGDDWSHQRGCLAYVDAVRLR